MKSKRTVSLFFSIAVMGACALSAPVASATQSALMFQGGLVNAGCDANVADASGQQASEVSLAVRHDRMDACAGGRLPIASTYVEESSIMTGKRTGVLTLTYL